MTDSHKDVNSLPAVLLKLSVCLHKQAYTVILLKNVMPLSWSSHWPMVEISPSVSTLATAEARSCQCWKYRCDQLIFTELFINIYVWTILTSKHGSHRLSQCLRCNKKGKEEGYCYLKDKIIRGILSFLFIAWYHFI